MRDTRAWVHLKGGKVEDGAAVVAVHGAAVRVAVAVAHGGVAVAAAAVADAVAEDAAAIPLRLTHTLHAPLSNTNKLNEKSKTS